MNHIKQPKSFIFDIPDLASIRKLDSDGIKQFVSIHELVSNMIFIEFFAGEDADMLRHEYKSSLFRKFKTLDVGHMELPEYAVHLALLGTKLNFNLATYLKDPKAVWNIHAQTSLSMRRKKHMTQYNQTCSDISEAYDDILNWYKTTPTRLNAIEVAKENYGGMVPRVVVHSPESVVITFIDTGL